MGLRPPGGEGALPAFAWGVATLWGVGRVPGAPGTAASAVGLALYWLLYQGGGVWPPVAVLLLVAGGIWSAGVVERLTGRKDPPEVVVDELAGQMLCLLGAPPTAPHLAAAFVLFRFFDIVKPVRWVEAFPRGWGVVADDLVAGALAWLLLAGGRAAGIL